MFSENESPFGRPRRGATAALSAFEWNTVPPVRLSVSSLTGLWRLVAARWQTGYLEEMDGARKRARILESPLPTAGEGGYKSGKGREQVHHPVGSMIIREMDGWFSIFMDTYRNE